MFIRLSTNAGTGENQQVPFRTGKQINNLPSEAMAKLNE